MDGDQPTCGARFATFEVDFQSGELRKGGLKLKLSGQPFQVLAALLEKPGKVVTREELQQRIWPDSFVDFDHNLNAAVNKIREVLRDSAESPCFIETLPRRGYRFIASVEPVPAATAAKESSGDHVPAFLRRIWRRKRSVLLVSVCALAPAGVLLYVRHRVPSPPSQHSLTRLTFDDGLQIGATWSPDGRLIAYSSDRGGKFDIWVQQVGVGDAIQITKGPGNNWQPDWSPDGKSIVYRSEGRGGLFVIPALGGEGFERKIASFGYYPRWSPDGSQILFRNLLIIGSPRFYVVGLHNDEPREVFADLIVREHVDTDSAAWHPDGKRLSMLLLDPSPSPRIWTLPLSGNVAAQSEISPLVAKQFAEASAPGGSGFGRRIKFSWSPRGDAIYCDRLYRGARNLWRMTVDPVTLRVVAVQRLTTGPGQDLQAALSTDGKRLAFTAETRHVRTWIFPFDATHGRLAGTGKAVTSPARESWTPNLSPDGSKIVFHGTRGSSGELWEKSLVDGHETPILGDDYTRYFPRWSPDGARVASVRINPSTNESQITVWSSQTHREEPVTPWGSREIDVYDWFPDGESLVATLDSDATHRLELWQVPVAGTGAVPAARRLVSNPGQSLFQGHVSPDGRWLVYEAVQTSARVESSIYVTPVGGGRPTLISEGDYWDDKPRWSPDGKTIYYLSGRGGAYNIWGARFDPVKGRRIGAAFQITSFENVGLAVPDNISAVEFSLTQDKFALTMEDRSGSIWMLDNVDR